MNLQSSTPAGRTEHNCLICGTLFVAGLAAKYCGVACRRKAELQRYANPTRSKQSYHAAKPSRNEAGKYKTPGTVPFHPTDDGIAKLFAVMIGREAHDKPDIKPTGHRCQQNRRQCARCKTWYCDLCVTVVHPVCEKGAKP